MRPDILTVEGHYFDFTNPEAATFTILSIAHALANTCRFGGHCSTFYSVAQHSVIVSHIVPEKDALAGLLHDGHEAFIHDLCAPLKTLLPDYRALEKRIERAVLARFGIGSIPDSVKHADLVALATERRDLMAPHTDEWQILNGIVPLSQRIIPLSHHDAKTLFLARFEELTKGAT